MATPEFTVDTIIPFLVQLGMYLSGATAFLVFVFPRLKFPLIAKLVERLSFRSSLSKRVMIVYTLTSYAIIAVLFFILTTTDSISNSQVLFLTLGIVLLGAMQLVLNFEHQVVKPLDVVAKQATEFSEKNLSVDVRYSEGIGEVRRLVHANRQLANVIRTVISNIKKTSTELADSAEELAAGSQEVAATTEEVTGTIQNIAEGAAEQVRQIEEISKILNRVVEVVEDSVRKISVTSNITLDIAEQTNLISLNAAIEAARAGASGQGFGVVADQVRKLSIESKNAAASISKMTDNIGENIRNAVQEIIDAVDKIAGVAENTAASAEEAAAAAEEQAASLQEITEHAQKLSELADKSQAEVREWVL